MVVKCFEIEFSELATSESIRLSPPFILPTINYKYDKISNYLAVCDSGSRPKGGISNDDDGEAISIGGEQINVDGSIDFSKIPYVSYDFYQNAKKGKVENLDILICKDGALTGKTCLINFDDLPKKEVMVNEHVYVLRGNSEINQKFLFYLTRSDFFQNQIKDLAYRKKAQPGLNSDHFKKIKIPAISKEIQDQIVAKIEPIEQKIKDLKSQIKKPQEVINKVFAREFGFDLKGFERSQLIKDYLLDLSDFASNKDIRQSVKFHRPVGKFVLEELNKITNKRIKDFILEPIVLGSGISPKDFDDTGDYGYVGMSNIKNWCLDKDGVISVSRKFEVENKKKTIVKNDILIARSGEGTIGKCALIEDDEINAIFADFTMRIRLKNYNQRFAYYFFRTTYFQVLIEINKKGLGNNTNIFPSQIREFPIIDIPLTHQQKIVDEIKLELDLQEQIKKQIEAERQKIDVIIEQSISS